MKSIRVSILGKQYPLRVEDHDEELMYQIARYVDDRFKVFKDELAGQAEITVIVLACLSIAEELFLERRNSKSNTDNNSEYGSSEEMMSQVNSAMRKLLSEIKAEISHIE